MKRLLYSIIFLLFFSCELAVPRAATEAERKEVMNNVAFDHTLVGNIDRYYELKDFLLTYGDTIVSYLDSKNYVIEVESGNKIDTVLQSQSCYNFFQANPSNDIKNVPDYLCVQLNSIYNKIGNQNIMSFEVCRDKTIRIQVRDEGGGNGLYISHDLIWNPGKRNDYRYVDHKDTLISEDCIYRIGMTEHHGH